MKHNNNHKTHRVTRTHNRVTIIIKKPDKYRLIDYNAISIIQIHLVNLQTQKVICKQRYNKIKVLLKIIKENKKKIKKHKKT